MAAIILRLNLPTVLELDLTGYFRGLRHRRMAPGLVSVVGVGHDADCGMHEPLYKPVPRDDLHNMKQVDNVNMKHQLDQE
jgi:hypothetical protein